MLSSQRPMKMTQKKTENDHLAETRAAVVAAALPHVAFDGWSETLLSEAIVESGVEPGLARLAFPRGAVDLALAFHRLMDARLEEDLNPADLGAMRIRERVTHCVRTRIELVADEREAVRRGATLFALPMHAPDGAKAIWETADLIWRLCGDTATDYNWYTKRAILSGVYGSTVLYWLGDQDPDFAPTWAFLDRRIEDVMRFEKAKAGARENPLARAAFALPGALLGMIKAPSGS